jgi:hypothetical protein
MTSAPGAFLTIRAPGPLEGVVTISVTQGKGELLVEAAWKPSGADPRSASATVSNYAAASALAHLWADELARGREPPQ